MNADIEFALLEIIMSEMNKIHTYITAYEILLAVFFIYYKALNLYK